MMRKRYNHFDLQVLFSLFTVRCSLFTVRVGGIKKAKNDEKELAMAE